MATNNRIPLTDAKYRESVIQSVNAQDYQGQPSVITQAPVLTPALTPAGKKSTPAPVIDSSVALNQTLSDLTLAIEDLKHGLGIATGDELMEWASFPTSGGSERFSLATEGGSSVIEINFGSGEVLLDGNVKGNFNDFGKNPARFVQISVDNSCKMAFNSRAQGVFDFSVNASPMTIEGAELERIYIIFTTTYLSMSFVANSAKTQMSIQREIPVTTMGQITPKHGTSAQTTGVDASSGNAITLSASADITPFDVTNGNNTYDITWGENNRFAGFHLHAVEGGGDGISEELGWQYRPASGNISGVTATQNNWSQWFYRTSVSNCTDLSWLPENRLFFETSSTLRFNITSQNYLLYDSSTAAVYPTVIVEEY